jgi:ribosome-binding factor A
LHAEHGKIRLAVKNIFPSRQYFKFVYCQLWFCKGLKYDSNMETIKQKKIASLLRETLGEIFQRENLSITQGGMITISHVTISPDLTVARVYLSFFQVKNQQEILDSLAHNENEMRRKLGNKIRNQVRRIPELHFFVDDTLDQVFRMEEIFKQIHKKEDED